MEITFRKRARAHTHRSRCCRRRLPVASHKITKWNLMVEPFAVCEQRAHREQLTRIFVFLFSHLTARCSATRGKFRCRVYALCMAYDGNEAIYVYRKCHRLEVTTPNGRFPMPQRFTLISHTVDRGRWTMDRTIRRRVKSVSVGRSPKARGTRNNRQQQKIT